MTDVSDQQFEPSPVPVKDDNSIAHDASVNLSSPDSNDAAHSVSSEFANWHVQHGLTRQTHQNTVDVLKSSHDIKTPGVLAL